MTNNTDQKINDLYSKMLETADTIGKEGITEESIESLKNIESCVNEVTLNDEATTEIKIDVPNGEFESRTVMQAYDPITGDQTVVDGYDSIADKIADRHLDNLINGEVTDQDLVNEVLKEIGTFGGGDSTSVIASLIVRRMSGDKFNVYEAMPDDYKRQVDMIYNETSMRYKNVKGINVRSKNSIASMMLDDMIEDFKKSMNAQVDLDTVLSGFDKEVEKMQEDLSTELGGIMMTFDEERKAEIDAAIKRCEENGNTEAIESLKVMRDTIDDAFKLDSFIEFCKTCKIKNIEAREPEKRVFFHFNKKYENHRYTINDIRSCPSILDRHLESSHLQNTLLCIAFCKYCNNMNPDNINEHTFMYYFIRNIITIDRLNPKGRLYEGMDERSKHFYDTFITALRAALTNLLERNPTFKEHEARGMTNPYIYHK